MSLEDDFRDFAMESREFQGKALASLENLTNYVGAVSRKADEIRRELNEHKDSQNAHGLGSASRFAKIMTGWIGLLVSAAALAIAIFRTSHGTR